MRKKEWAMEQPTTAEAPLDLDDLVRVPGVQGFDLSPDGRTAVIVWNASGKPQLYLVDLAGPGEPRQLTSGDQAAFGPAWSPRGDLIAYLSDQGGNENADIFLIDPQGGEPRKFTDAPNAANFSPAWSPDGAQLAYSSNRGGHFDIWVQSLDGTSARRLTDALPPDHNPRWSPDGTQIAFSSNRSNARDNEDIFLISVSGERREIQVSPNDGAAHEHSPQWSPDGKQIAFVSDARGEEDILVATVDGHLVTPIAQTEWEELQPTWSPDGKQLAYRVNRDGQSELLLKTLSSGVTTSLQVEPGVISTFDKFAFTPDGTGILCLHSSGQRPGDLVLVATDGQTPMRRITDSLGSFAGRITADQLVQPTTVRWSSADGTTVPGLLYQPHQRAAGQLPPAIIVVHGGPTGQSMNTWVPVVQYYVSRGYVVLAPNVRGSTGYGKTYREANIKDWGGGDLADLVAGARFLATEGFADPQRIGVTGGSYGGYMTLMALTKAPDVWAAGVSVVGVTNLQTLYASTRDDLRYYLDQQIGTPEENPDFYYDRSPINFVEAITAPLLILQGETDPRVPLHEAEQLRDRLAELDRPYDYHVYAAEGHGFRREDSRLDAARRTVAFFDHYLQP